MVCRGDTYNSSKENVVAAFHLFKKLIIFLFLYFINLWISVVSLNYSYSSAVVIVSIKLNSPFIERIFIYRFAVNDTVAMFVLNRTALRFSFFL